MPTQTFMNLPEEKKNAILVSAKKEFSRVEFSKSSINQIIKDAGISRGSFYMYFDDKKDMLMVVLESLIHGVKNNLFENIQASGGNLADTLIGVFDYFFQNYETKENQSFIKHTLLFLQSETENPMSPFGGKQPFRQRLFLIIPFLDQNQFASQDEESIKATVDIMFSVLQSVLMSAFVQNQSIEESRTRLQEYFKIIQNGYLRK